MAWIDGRLDDAEQTLLMRIAKKYSVSKAQLDRIRENPDIIKFVIPEDEDEKFSQLYDLVHMMIADDVIEDEEIELIKIFAKKFEYRSEAINDLIDSIIKNISNGQNAIETKKRVEFLIR